LFNQALLAAQAELETCQDRLHTLEDQLLSEDHSTTSKTEEEDHEQLAERNTLLLQAFGYLDRILGSDQSPVRLSQRRVGELNCGQFDRWSVQQRKGGQAELKPFTNFAVFSDGLLARLKDIGQLGQKFEQRVKEIDASFTNQLKYV
jgi:hypothetical protein